MDNLIKETHNGVIVKTIDDTQSTLSAIQTTEKNIIDSEILLINPKTIQKKRIKKPKNDLREDDIVTYEYFKTKIFDFSKKSPRKIFLYKKQLQNSLEKLNIGYKKTAKKEVLQELLFNNFSKLISYELPENIDKINIVQQTVKKYLQKKKKELYGPGYCDKSLCKNEEDIFSMESINDVEDIYFFSVKDSHNSIFFFDFRTFKKIVDKDGTNPYNREPFTSETMESYKKRLDYMNKNKISILFQEDIDYFKKLTPEKKIHNKLVDIFGEIDKLNVIAGGTRIEWFSNLNTSELKKLYKVLEDIWNYRAELTQTQKLEIVPNAQMFINSVNYVYNLHNKLHIQNIILMEMEKLVSSSSSEHHRHTGAYYILIAMTEISLECAQELPWLVQY